MLLDLGATAGFQRLGLRLDVGIGVLGKPAAGRQQQPLVRGHRLQQRFIQLQGEGKRVADQLEVFVAGERVACL
jgi:hypothetical protein